MSMGTAMRQLHRENIQEVYYCKKKQDTVTRIKANYIPERDQLEDYWTQTVHWRGFQ
jgi:hypothetical protein